MAYNICAPKKYDKNNDTCFTKDQLVEMAKAYNRFVTKKKLSPHHQKKGGNAFEKADLMKITNDKKNLLIQFKKVFSNFCDDELCYLKQDFMNEIIKNIRDEIENQFRSEGPEDSREWLSNFDIDKIFNKYENVIKEFKFLGAVPLDCGELEQCPLHNINFSQLYKKGIRKIGTVFNLDKYGEPGSHWVAAYFDIDQGNAYYCDSNGRKPDQEVINVVDQFRNYYKKTFGKDINYYYNPKKYQKDGSECGVYSCNFIIRLLAGEKFDNIINNPLSFKEINSCRNVYFSNRPSKYSPSHKCDPISN